jgi:uncharacterized protein (TIGR02145 family)
MNKTKFISLAASLVLAMAFIFSCSGDGGGNNNTSTCGGKEYDATVYSCERGELVGFCRGNSYYPEYQYCDNNGEIKEGTEISSSSLSSVGGSSSSSSVGGQGGGSSSSSSVGGQGGGSSSSGGGGGYTGSYGSVPHGGKTYKTVQIGTQTWMAENLNYDPGTGNSACYDNQASNCATYGHLYDWATAMGFDPSCNSNYCEVLIQPKHPGICPSGWHIPSNDDWDKLFRYVDGTGTSSPYASPTAGRYLKATSGWNSNGNGTDQYGFSALPGGSGNSDGNFYDVGLYGNWWSASGWVSNFGAYFRRMRYDEESAGWDSVGSSILFSVRCVKD